MVIMPSIRTYFPSAALEKMRWLRQVFSRLQAADGGLTGINGSRGCLMGDGVKLMNGWLN